MTSIASSDATTHLTGTNDGRPVSPLLATPTDLAAEGVESITDSLNTLVATAFALYVKTKNFHWHLAGPHFRDYHLMFDEQADAVLGIVDVLAERVRRIGGRTITSIGDIGARQLIQDDDDAFVEPLQMLERLSADNQHLTGAMRASHRLCEESGDVATSSLLEVFIDESEKRTWFLFEAAQSEL